MRFKLKDKSVTLREKTYNAHVGGAPAPLREVRSRYRHLEAQSTGSVHSMRPGALPSPSSSSEPSIRTRGQNRLPLVETVDKSPCLTSSESPQRKGPTGPSVHPIKLSLIIAPTLLLQPSLYEESMSTQMPVLPVMAPSSKSGSNADADPEEMLRKTRLFSLSVITVS